METRYVRVRNGRVLHIIESDLPLQANPKALCGQDFAAGYAPTGSSQKAFFPVCQFCRKAKEAK